MRERASQAPIDGGAPRPRHGRLDWIQSLRAGLDSTLAIRAYRVRVPAWKPPCQSRSESTTTCWPFGSRTRISECRSNSPWRTSSVLVESLASSCHIRTIHPLAGGFARWLLS